jgi:uncharacterized membrane protein YidH (DUF202 family)
VESEPAGAAAWPAADPVPRAADPGGRHRGHRPGRGGARRHFRGEGALKPPAEDIEDTDPGLARERTDLAWTRTAISYAAVGGAILKYRPSVGLPVLILSAVIWWLRRLPGTPGAGPRHDRRLLLITISITGISVVALVLSYIGYAPGVLR